MGANARTAPRPTGHYRSSSALPSSCTFVELLFLTSWLIMPRCTQPDDHYAAVFDGHGGNESGQFAASNLHIAIEDILNVRLEKYR